MIVCLNRARIAFLLIALRQLSPNALSLINGDREVEVDFLIAKSRLLWRKLQLQNHSRFLSEEPLPRKPPSFIVQNCATAAADDGL